MHEYAVVQSMVTQICERLDKREVSRVSAVRVRRGSTFAEAPLRQAWEMLTPESKLRGAKLIIDTYDVQHTCTRCGAIRRIGSDDLVGHLFICPSCGQAHHIDEAHGLELVEIIA